MSNYYAKQGINGIHYVKVLRFDTRKERDEYVRTHDYTDAVKASDLSEASKAHAVEPGE